MAEVNRALVISPEEIAAFLLEGLTIGERRAYRREEWSGRVEAVLSGREPFGVEDVLDALDKSYWFFFG